MKKLIILTFICSFLVSCEKDFLDHDPTSSLTEDTYYKNIGELEKGLVACYAAGFSGSVWPFDMFHWIFGDIPSDDADKGSVPDDDADMRKISYSELSAGISEFWPAVAWSWYYGAIGACNKLLDKAAGVPGDPAQIEKITDQAKFIRAVMYYHLLTVFGDVPLVTKFLTISELDKKRAPASEIWKQIESDLADASNLPSRSEWNTTGRITSGAALGLLGKVYLTQKKYTQANSAFSKIVRSGEYQLVPDYGFIYRHEGENCQESIFEIQFKNHMEINLISWTPIWRNPADYGGFGFHCPTKDLLSEFEKGDPRIIYTFTFIGDRFPAEDSSSHYLVNLNSPTGFNSRKNLIIAPEAAGMGMDYELNYRYMRYAEILLLYAESLNEAGKPDSALMLLNMVRARARNTPATDPQRLYCNYDLSYTGALLPDVTTRNKDELRNAIWHEERVELAMEGHRRNMLIRTGRLKERMEAAKAYAGCKVEPHEWLFPIPPSEIARSNYLITQNPGY